MNSKRYTQLVEEFWGPRFVELYNAKFGREFVIEGFNDQVSPDVECVENRTGEKLYVEVKRSASLKDDLRLDQLSVDNPEKFSETQFQDSRGMRGNFETIVDRLKESIEAVDKENYNFGEMNVALIIPRVFLLWKCEEWLTYASHLLEGIADPIYEVFTAGIWFFCREGGGDFGMINLSDFATISKNGE